jgi:N utilization substance protein A
MKSDFALAFNEIVETRALPRERVLEALNQALVSAYRRDANVIESQQIEARIDADGNPLVFVEKEVVEEIVNETTETSLKEARQVQADAQLGDIVMVQVATSKTFGRIAAQTAKQVILQHIREAERETLFGEFVTREGDLTFGTVQNINNGTVTIDLGRTEAIMPANQRTPREHYKPHDRIRVYIVEVRKKPRGPEIIVSRNHKNMLRRLLEQEVPEIYNGQIEIMNIAREAGHRSKVAVMARQEGIDAVGACVGMRGMRIQNIVKELNEEKIDIIEWDPDPSKFIARALSPARVLRVLLEEEIDSLRTATVLVTEDQLSLAIGKEGQNARLAAKLSGWRIDIKSIFDAAQQAMNHIETSPLDRLLESHGELVAEVYRILAKKSEGRVVAPEEYTSIRQFAELTEGLFFHQRASSRRERQEMIDSVRPLVPSPAFKMPLAILELAPDIMQVIGRFENVGELWVRFMADEEALEHLLKEGGAAEDAMDAIRYALDDLVLPEIDAEEEEAPAAPAPEAKQAPVAPAPVILAAPVAPAPAAPPKAAPAPEASPAPEAPAAGPDLGVPDYENYLEMEEEEDFSDTEGDSKDPKSKGKKKGKNKRRQLVFDEDLGEVVAKRLRKRGAEDAYDEYL